MSHARPELEEEVLSDSQEQTSEPPMYRVLLHNDDYTTMEFVVEVLIYVFHKAAEDATRIMLDVHREGTGICGLYPYDVAETKVETVRSMARERGFPLKCTLEKE